METVGYNKFRTLKDYVEFNGDRALGQNQYASRYVDGRLDYPNLGEGLRWKVVGDTSNYHFIKIHKDDYEEFHRRVREYNACQ